MDHERLPQQENEKKFAPVPIDEHIFDTASTLVATKSDERWQQVRFNSISRAREGALEYAIWTFEHVADTDHSALDPEVQKRLEEEARHGLKEALGSLSLVLGYFGLRLDSPEDTRAKNHELELAALRYAKQAAEAFQEAIQKSKDPSVAAAELGVRDPQLLVKLSDVMARLPDMVPEKLRKNVQ